MPHRLLLADDSVTIQRVIELTFADEDIEVIAVGDGREAIRRIEADPPDIVLADVGMPEKDGYEVAAFVKNSPRLKHIPVLLLTGAFEPVDERRAQEVGCDGVLAKPFEPQMVITRVNELLQAAPPPRAALPSPVVLDKPAAPAVLPAVEPAIAAPPIAPPVPAALAPAPPPRALPAPPIAPPAPPIAQPLSPLDAFLAAAPAVDLDAYASRARVAVQPHEAQPEKPEQPVEHQIQAEPAAAPLSTEGVAATPPPVPPPVDPSAIRISRRTPIAVPGFGAPALPPASTTAELDDYFEKLDAAFATLQQAPVKADPLGASTAPGGAPAQSSHPTQPLHLPTRWSAPPPEPAAAATEADSEAGDHAPAIAQAFSALLAAEHGQAMPAQTPSVTEAPTLTPEATDELVERIAGLVLERLSDRVVRDTVIDIVSRIAEKLVREEIDRVKATIK